MPDVAQQPDLFAMPKGAPPAGTTTAAAPFWLVICTEANEEHPGKVMLTRGYKFVHETEGSAEKEALRLAMKYRGYEFAVVKSIAAVVYSHEKKRAVWDEC